MVMTVIVGVIISLVAVIALVRRLDRFDRQQVCLRNGAAPCATSTAQPIMT
jgi:hypothetical protein